MRISGATLGERVKRIDPVLFFAVAYLSIISILIVFGAVDNFGKSKLIMQIAMTLVGTVAVFIISNLDYKYLVERSWLIMIVGSVALFFGQKAIMKKLASTHASAETCENAKKDDDANG